MVEVGDTVAISYVAKVVSTGVDAIVVQGGNWYLPDEYRVVPSLPTEPGSLVKNIVTNSSHEADVAVLDSKGRWWFVFEGNLVYTRPNTISGWEPWSED